MKRERVSSSDISSIGYNAEDKILEIEFHSGKRIYQFFNVPVSLFQGLMSASSHGRYFHKMINRKFDYQEL